MYVELINCPQNFSMQKLFLSILSVFVFLFTSGQAKKTFSESLKKEMREKIVEATRHAWNGYTQYAWGYDDLQPLTKNGKNWYTHSLLMTPVDAYDTFVMLGMKKEAEEAKQLILSKLDFNTDNEVQVFEIAIRLLGGLEAAYEMDGNKKFLTLAIDLADRLLPAFNTPTGMPYRYIHLQTGKVRDSINNPAEIGTLLLEFGKLSKITGDAKYFNAARKAIMELYKRRSKIDLVGLQINVLTGEWAVTTSAIGAYIDSYYEYLYKGWKLFGEKEFKTAWDVHQAAIKKYLVSKQDSGWFLRQVDMHTGKEIGTKYGALDAFYAALCVYAGDIKLAKQNQKANYFMWTKFKIEPEVFDFKTGKMLNGYYVLRPENIESSFYLYRFTKDDQYLWMGKRMVDDVIIHCRNEVGYASLKNVQTLERANSMQSFFFAETLKYAWLLFAPDSALDFKKYVLTTEAHPFKLTK